MRILLQRVTRASVTVVEKGAGEIGEPSNETAREVGRIGPGAVALAGFAPGDAAEAIEWMAAKIANLRIFPGAEGGSPFDVSLRETGGELLVVSQFTLYGDTRQGRRPDFGEAAPYGEAKALYEEFVEQCEVELPGKVVEGEFGAVMRVSLVNDGPVTLWLER
ncbi:MAG: D-aminoacyl-tRNA deacylase [Thermoanaerobaculia bacterium]|nr:D-aminoacyl-tRNA deacylase [Thermoanaerobaculia bacterium]